MFDTNKKYGILGMARSGIAAAYKIKELGGSAFLSELQWKDKIPSANQLMEDFPCEFGGHTNKLLDCDCLIVSPGIPLDVPILSTAKAKGIELISEIEFGYQIKAPDSKIIAVTGSNGKSTTASLIHHILVQMGSKSILAGNIGDAFCSYPIHKPGIEFIVLEISSFQLDLITSFKPDVAVLLNITPDHMNRYASFEDYSASKTRIFKYQDENDCAVLFLDAPNVVKSTANIKARKLMFSLHELQPKAYACLSGKFIHFGLSTMVSIYDLGIKGPHNYANTMAAMLAVHTLVPDSEAIGNAVKGFKPLTHRLEYAGSVRGVSFYNDSKATNTDSVRSALFSFERPIRIIVGGSDKGEDFSVLTDDLQRKAQKVYITGDTQDQMRQAWLGKVPLVCIDDFETCVRTAFEEALAGDVIVLSPACASFDHFHNFEHRGDVFKQIVESIIAENEKK
ncbi:MAG: UDP-N-acetylmuramoyl-L-alanine--D-glutamate ligase [Candidatus Cloacimonetes bacterium]|nr:UDP-N-acetylmuramoyl-L-alanine--D-glutamate ligase [Candidatus Cloacimonadota bacterium]